MELLTIEPMKLLEIARGRITEDENGENVPRLEITKVLLVHCNTMNRDYQHNS